MSETTSKRPGLVTFAAIMMFVLGGFSVVWAIEEFVNAAWLSDVSSGLFGKNLFIWGITDSLVAIVSIFAGWSILRGGRQRRPLDCYRYRRAQCHQSLFLPAVDTHWSLDHHCHRCLHYLRFEHALGVL